MDVLTQRQRHKSMSHIRSKDTGIELALRKKLWEKGYRYRKNYRVLPGKPDIVLTKYRLAIFCDSEFWHGYDWDTKKAKISVNRDYWISKIEGNMARDERVNRQLESMGWTVLRFWGKDIKKHLDECVANIEDTVLEIILKGYDER